MTTINGAYDHSNEEIVLIFANGQEHKVTTCSSINYSNGRTSGSIGGNQVGPVAITNGSAEPSWSMEIAKHEFNQIVAKMGNGYLNQQFEIVVSYKPSGSLPRATDEIRDCQLDDDGHSSATGDPAMVSIGGPATGAYYNGIDPFGTPGAA